VRLTFMYSSVTCIFLQYCEILPVDIYNQSSFIFYNYRIWNSP
jgi:hypothetical protein